MLPGCWIVVLLLLLLLPTVTQAQSGDGETEPRISCTSDIMVSGSNLTCKLVGGRSDDEDDEDDDGVEKMTVCYTSNWSEKRSSCKEHPGDTASGLKAVRHFNVTVHLKTGAWVTTMIDLKKIVKPRSPQVRNVTFSQDSHLAIVSIQTPYQHTTEYLSPDKQLFQLYIWNSNSSMVQNISSLELKINMQHLQRHCRYKVRVRAMPQGFLQGSWSEWSPTFTFVTPADVQSNEWLETLTLTVCLVFLVVVTSSMVFFGKNKILTYMWPSIPHPKHTLVHICKPHKGILLNFKPEVFSVLNVFPLEKPEPSSDAAAADADQPSPPCSTQSSDSSTSTTSVSTEELELSALLSSSDGEDGLQTSSLSPVHVLQPDESPPTPPPGRSAGGNQPEGFGASRQKEAYVTMSSFYQIK